MINDLDTSLKAMLQGEAAAGSSLASATISFSVPDTTWQGQGTGMQLDVYLYRVIDNRELRSNQRFTSYNSDGTTTTTLFPSRIECSYIISAWDKGSEVEGMEKEPDEHELLSDVIWVLWRNPTMPTKYLTGTLTSAYLALPIFADETEDMAAKPDFWSGLDTYVRPAITCRITIEMDLDNAITGVQATMIGMVTEQLAGAIDQTQTAIIGGTIRNATTPTTVIPNAWILLDASMQTYLSDENGQFVIPSIAFGSHTMTVRAIGYAQAIQSFTVPSPSGIYDVSLTPI
ncbi:MAG TPA: Pvc16 family protein [Verrucomicrobiae bacterium]|nr:Pvc16 family protein [Verrucomicrobiae bacterium]HTZ56035.1 Pvc16 family protein [Candidatus Acidoferrum sp.]